MLDGGLRVLREVFGLQEFRLGQEPVIEAQLQGRDVLAVAPTGSGKSLSYWVPAVLTDGLTLVVSPLIALMKDQVDFLVRHGVAAARLDSTLEAAESRRIFEDLRADLQDSKVGGGRVVPQHLEREEVPLGVGQVRPVGVGEARGPLG